ncbi:unnamed protein product [Ceutorhynchus assimilis]|uniref:Small ribosomal subunit protein mS23 n=1 Tax=Ceutorhynchus assimilis TaxID=467358 RepID=A0A9N9MRJ1_9CUCU|nr:unnamed protein product [Ceutorhynchus assimilis]
MAGSRLEKVGTIFTRATGLMQAKAVTWEDRPVWYDVYAAFPPKEEPRFDRPAPDMKIKQIFYEDDKIRAIFHRNNKQIGTGNLLSSHPSLTQRFIETYKKVSQQYKGEADEKQIYVEAIDVLNRERSNREEAVATEEVSLSLAFKKAQSKQEKTGLSIKDIFKD